MYNIRKESTLPAGAQQRERSALLSGRSSLHSEASVLVVGRIQLALKGPSRSLALRREPPMESSIDPLSDACVPQVQHKEGIPPDQQHLIFVGFRTVSRRSVRG